MAVEGMNGTAAESGSAARVALRIGSRETSRLGTAMRSRWFKFVFGCTLLADIPCTFLVPVGWKHPLPAGSGELVFLGRLEAEGLLAGSLGLAGMALILVHAAVCCALLVAGAILLIRFFEETW